MQQQHHINSESVCRSQLQHHTGNIVVIQQIYLQIKILIFLHYRSYLPIFQLLTETEAKVNIFFYSVCRINATQHIFFYQNFAPLILIIYTDNETKT